MCFSTTLWWEQFQAIGEVITVNDHCYWKGLILTRLKILMRRLKSEIRVSCKLPTHGHTQLISSTQWSFLLKYWVLPGFQRGWIIRWSGPHGWIMQRAAAPWNNMVKLSWESAQSLTFVICTVAKNLMMQNKIPRNAIDHKYINEWKASFSKYIEKEIQYIKIKVSAY